MKKFLTVALAVLLIIFFTFPTSGFGDIQGTTTDGGGGESTVTTQTPPDSTTTTTSPDSTTTTMVPDNSTTTTIVLGDTTPSQTTIAPDSSTTTTETTLPLDITPPVIILNGDAIIELKTGDIFTDPGATATDNKDESVTVTASGTVDTSKVGIYTLTYNASDTAGNAALSIIRIVNVAELLDIIPPVIILNGDAIIELKTGDIFADPGATATDNKDESVTVTASGTVDTSKVGSYNITYNASDTAGNAALTVTRTVNVAELPDTTPPVITLIGNTVINILIGKTFVDPGATAKDDKDLDVQVITTGIVDVNVAGSYTISYDASDIAGNTADTVTRTVRVSSTATVNTDKPDYIPSDYVLVTGSGWLPGETVKLDFSETLFDPIFQQTLSYYTVADSEGNIRDLQYLIEIRHLGASFILTATGQTSGLTAQTTFTDSTVSITITKDVYASNGTSNISDTHHFTVTLKKLGSDIPIGTGTVWEGSPITFTDNNATFALSNYYVEEDSEPGYTPFSGVGSLKMYYGSNINFMVKNKLAATTTVRIKKEVYSPDGITIDGSNATPFTIELWEANSLGGPAGSKAVQTVTLTGNSISDPISVSPGLAYIVKEITIDPNYKISYDPSSGVVYPEFSGTKTPVAGSTDTVFTVKNTKTKAFTITKTGLKNHDIARFTLHGPSGIIKTGLGLDSIILDCYDDPNDITSGLISDTYTWYNLQDGAYYLEENYDVGAANDYSYTSNLDSNNQYSFNITGSSKTFTVINYAKGTIKAYKTDKAGLPLKDAVIGLYTTNIGNPSPIMEVSSIDVAGPPYPTNVEFFDVPSGGVAGIKYYIHEISAPAGYAADPLYYEVTISESDLNPILSTPIINKANGSITFYKKDKLVDGNPIPGAVFGLYTEENETLTPIKATSDADGKVEFTELTCDLTYYIREISAPAGFVLDEAWYSGRPTKEFPQCVLNPVINVVGGTITVTKNVIAPDGKTDVDDPKVFKITLERKEGSDWIPVKTADIKEGFQVEFSVPLNITYRVVEATDSKYTETDKASDRIVTLTTQGQIANICLINKQHYALIVMGKVIYQLSSPFVITNDDHIFFTKVEGEYAPLIEWHPIATKIPTFFPVWPGTYNVVEKTDFNYNGNGQPVILSGFKLSDFDLANSGDVASLLYNIWLNLGKGSKITVEGDDIVPLIIANQYTPDYRNVTVTKDVVAPDGSPASDPKEFNVKLQRLSLTLPNILNMLDLSNVGNVTNLSDLMSILDLTQLTNLSNLVGWEDVGAPQDVAEGNPVTFMDVEKDHIYRVVETQVPGYMQMCGMLPFYLEPDETTDKQIDIVNRQEMIIIKVVKNVIGSDDSDVSDNHEFFVKLDGKCLPLYHPFAEGSPTVFAVLPGTYTAMECFESEYNLVDNGGTFTVNFGDGTICNPKIITITNKQKPGSIVITKTVIGGSDKATFNIDGPGSNDFNSIVLASGESWSNTNLPWGTYKITETSMNGYQTPSFIVNGKAPVAASSVDVKIGNGDCECLGYRVNVTNTVIPGSLTINKTVVGGSDNATFNVDGPGSNDFGGTIGQGGSLSFTNLPWGTYTITEAPISGYQTPSFVINGGAPVAASSVVVIIGNEITQSLTYIVDVTNTVIPGSLTISKTVVGGSDSATFFVDGPADNDFSFNLAPNVAWSRNDLPWGTYTITESPISGYQTPSFIVDGGGSVATSAVAVIIGNGQGAALTHTVDVTNTVLPGSITINKTGMLAGDSIVFTVTGPAGFIPATVTLTAAPGETTATAVLNNLAWGDYTITETINPNYSATPSFAVTTGFNLVQNAGNSVTITIPGTGAENSKIVDATLTVTNIYTPPTTPPATSAPSTTQVEVLGLATGEELSQEPARISVLGIKELPLTGENILLIFGGILLIGALSLILALSLRKRPAK